MVFCAFRQKQGRAATRAALALALLALGAGAAMAQSAVCRQIEAEIAALDRPVSRPGGSATRERAQLARIQGNIAAMNCNRGFVLFAPPLPPQCADLKAQAGALSARIAQIEAPRQVASAGNPQRRQQLLATYNAYNCRSQQVAAAPPPQQPRSFFEALFGRSDQPGYATPTAPGGDLPPLVDGQPVDDRNAKKFSGGGNLAICVRTCDGFFFPVNYEGTSANDMHQEMCEASCPASPTEVYWMPAGADLDRAANEAGQNYTAMPNAFRYRQSYDPSCTCKTRDQTWAQVLRQADQLLGAKRTDITVTAESSDQMARSEPVKGLRGVRDRKQTRGEPATTGAAPQAEEKFSTDFATNGAASSGIGPRQRDGKVIATGEGPSRSVIGRDGEARTIRVVQP